jgi:hypothetical protein
MKFPEYRRIKNKPPIGGDVESVTVELGIQDLKKCKY